jgi:hypothetical protein
LSWVVDNTALESAESFLYGDLMQYVKGVVLSKKFVSQDKAATINASMLKE